MLIDLSLSNAILRDFFRNFLMDFSGIWIWIIEGFLGIFRDFSCSCVEKGRRVRDGEMLGDVTWQNIRNVVEFVIILEDFPDCMGVFNLFQGFFRDF